jgi:hypothetical protein
LQNGIIITVKYFVRCSGPVGLTEKRGEGIDMRLVSRPPFSSCADGVPFELVVSAALLGRKNCGGGGQIVFQIFTTVI